jgi:hypothetical protein
MSDHDHRALLRVDEAFGGSDVVLKRGERVLNRDDVVAVIQKQRDEVLEAASVSEGAVHEHDCGFGSA